MAGDARDAGDLSPFCPRLVAAWIGERPDELHRRLEGTLVSADLSGFTAMSERLSIKGKRGVEELTAAINSCFTALIDVAAAFDGDVLKFGGDALLLWFGDGDSAVRAVRAAVRMQRVLATRFRTVGLAMSIGVHRDSFDAFLVGRPDWRELVLAGAAVSATVALESEAAPGEVRVSPATAAALPEGWTVASGDTGWVIDHDRLGRSSARRAERHWVDPELARLLVAPPLRDEVRALAASAGEHRLATVVFAEVTGTDAAVAAGAHDFARSIDGLLRSVQDDADRLGTLLLGTDVVADGVKIILVSGAPVSTGYDEEAALRFATELVRDAPLHVLRAGVNRGRIFAGFLGSPDRRTYTVMGDPVNLAARVMGRAETGQVVATRETVRRSDALFEVVDLPPFLVKGRTQPVTAHIVGPRSGGRRARADVALPIVGRDVELARLRGAIDHAIAGAGRVIEIAGAPGIGKSRLLDAVRDDERMTTFVTECQPYDALSPFAALRPLLRSAFGITADAAPSAAGRELTELVSRLAPEALPMLPFVAAPLGADVAPTPQANVIAEQFRPARMHEAVLDVLAAAAPQPTLFLVEDVHNMDDASLQLLGALSVRVPTSPWVLVVTRRPEGPGLISDARSERLLVELQPLAAEAAALLATLALEAARFDEPDLDTLIGRAGGNPLFLLELVTAAAASLGTDELPESIERVVAARVDRLDPADRAVLRHAAVIGRVFDASIVELLVDAGSTGPVPEWTRLGDFLEGDAKGRWRFRHALIRDVAYEGLPYERRAHLHGAVGRILEERSDADPDPALLSLHFSLAGDAPRTWRYAVAAGEAATRALAVAEAIAAYRRALQVRRRVPGLDALDVSAVAEALSDALELAAAYPEAAEACALARRSGRDRQSQATRARLMRNAAALHERGGRYPAALRVYTRARHLVTGSTNPDDLAEASRLAFAYSAVCYRQGRHRLSADWASRAMLEGRLAGDALCVAGGQSLLVLAAVQGLVENGEELGELALAEFDRQGKPARVAMVLNNLGMLAYFKGDWDLAATRYRQSADAFLAAGDVANEALATNNFAEVLSDQGDYDGAAVALEHVHRAWSASGYSLGIALATSNLGRLAARTGDLTRGRSLLADAYEEFVAIGAGEHALEALARRAELSVLAGDPVGAAALLAEARDHPHRAAAHPSSLALLERVAGWADLLLDDTERAGRRMQAALERASHHGLELDLALAHDGLARVARIAGDRSAQRRHEDARNQRLARLGVRSVPQVPVSEPSRGAT